MGQPLKVVGVYMNEELSGGDNNRFYAGEELLGYMRQQRPQTITMLNRCIRDSTTCRPERERISA